MSGVSLLERILEADLKRHSIPFEREHTFAPDRKWRSDFRILNSPILVEVEGGAGFGRHSRREGFLRDGAKYAAAARLGYIVLRFTKPQIEGRMEPGMDSEAIETIRTAYRYWKESA